MCLYINTEEKFRATLNYFCEFIIKTNFAADRKVQRELPENKQELFRHLPLYFGITSSKILL